ncbi:MAG TPA: ABC transporter ATP-binding protein [Alphaproteobacteria bacterium]
MPELVLNRVSKFFGETVAVDDLSLSIGDGEFVCLLGPSGCGKTTTLRMIAGFERVDTGTIKLDGEDITDQPPQKRDIGLVFQHYALFPHMTVAQNVGYGLKVRGHSRGKIDEEVEAALSLVRLGELAGRYPSQLSGGQQQRVALARALAIRPRLLLLDEPLSNLDAKLRDDMREEIRRIQKQVGITAIFVTHDQAEAFGLADRIAVMTHGRLRQMADPVSIYEQPASALVSGFIGQVNVLKGKIVALDGGRARAGIDSGLEITGIAANLGPGDLVTSMIKQERVVLSRHRPAGSENVFSCKIAARTYLGASINYQCQIERQTINAIVPNHPAFERFEAGESAFAKWSSADCRMFHA